MIQYIKLFLNPNSDIKEILNKERFSPTNALARYIQIN